MRRILSSSQMLPPVSAARYPRKCRGLRFNAAVKIVTAVLAFLIAFIALSSVEDGLPAIAQSPSPTVAHVYVQTARGVNVYQASSAGKLTVVSGSPFATVGQMEGVNGRYLLSVGTTKIHVYPVAANGGIGKQVAVLDTQSYAGSRCGTTSFQGTPNGAILDHTGTYFYIQLYGATEPGSSDPICADWQTYKIASNGQLIFLGDVETDFNYAGYVQGSSIPTISSNGKFAYGITGGMGNASFVAPFTTATNGVLEVNNSFTEVDPVAPSGYAYYPFYIKADPGGHLAAIVGQTDVAQDVVPTPFIASYGINAAGGIYSTNTHLPVWPGAAQSWPMGMTLSPSGLLLAVYGWGLQLFHFNGLSNPTPYTSWLTSQGYIVSQVQWDRANHLYALTYDSEKLYVFTATPTSVAEAAGSPYAVPAPYGIHGLIVVPK